MTKFNLLEEPWIPVRKGTRVIEVGLAQALLDSPQIDRVETPSPLEEAAIHRLLLAVLHRALNGPSDLFDALNLYERGAFPSAEICCYLDKHYDRFNLFHEDHPFFQIADLPDDRGLKKPWTKLLPELATGHNPTLFDHSQDDNPPLASYAQAARALLVHQAFTPGGLIRQLGVTSASAGPLAGVAVFLVQGQTLFETLVFNLCRYVGEDDRPIWEAPPLRCHDVEAGRTQWPLSGRTRIYTWPSRGVKLLDEGDGVRFMLYGPGVKPLPAGFRDPMLAYVQGPHGQSIPARLDLEKSFWRDFRALLPQAHGQVPAVLAHAWDLSGELGGPSRLPVNVIGQVTDQAKVLDMRREVYPLPKGAFDQFAPELEEALELAEKVGEHLQRVGKEVLRSLTAGNRPEQQRGASQESTRTLPLLPHYWASLDRAFPEFLRELTSRDVHKSLAHWREVVERAARDAWDVTRQSLGDRARHLRAIQAREIAFAKAIREVRRLAK